MFPARSLFSNLRREDRLSVCSVWKGKSGQPEEKSQVEAYDIHYYPVKQSMRHIREEIPFRMKSRFFPRGASDAGRRAFKGNRSGGIERGRNRPVIRDPPKIEFAGIHFGGWRSLAKVGPCAIKLNNHQSSLTIITLEDGITAA
ncbi:hypothetical protein TNCV_3203841 [Trichonephila clavipes]|nr:hypothetical protein TNCV_3203841 [Trichonephila clavipes]